MSATTVHRRSINQQVALIDAKLGYLVTQRAKWRKDHNHPFDPVQATNDIDTHLAIRWQLTNPDSTDLEYLDWPADFDTPSP